MGDEEGYQGIRRREMNTAVNIFPKIQFAENWEMNKNDVTIMQYSNTERYADNSPKHASKLFQENR